jgi:WD40 repeat protein
VQTGHADNRQVTSDDEVPRSWVAEDANVWDPASGRALLSVRGHSRDVNSLSCSPGGKCLASPGGDGTVRVWESASGKQLLQLRGQDDLVWGVAWRPDGKRLAMASRDGNAKVWESANGQKLVYGTDIQDLLELARRRATRHVSPEECVPYLQSGKCAPMP